MPSTHSPLIDSHDTLVLGAALAVLRSKPRGISVADHLRQLGSLYALPKAVGDEGMRVLFGAEQAGSKKTLEQADHTLNARISEVIGAEGQAPQLLSRLATLLSSLRKGGLHTGLSSSEFLVDLRAWTEDLCAVILLLCLIEPGSSSPTKRSVSSSSTQVSAEPLHLFLRLLERLSSLAHQCDALAEEAFAAALGVFNSTLLTPLLDVLGLPPTTSLLSEAQQRILALFNELCAYILPSEEGRERLRERIKGEMMDLLASRLGEAQLDPGCKAPLDEEALVEAVLFLSGAR